MAENGAKRIRLGMVGGGTGAFIGYVHRIASRLDGDYDLVAGALSSRPEIAREKKRVLPNCAGSLKKSQQKRACRKEKQGCGSLVEETVDGSFEEQGGKNEKYK